MPQASCRRCRSHRASQKEVGVGRRLARCVGLTCQMHVARTRQQKSVLRARLHACAGVKREASARFVMGRRLPAKWQVTRICTSPGPIDICNSLTRPIATPAHITHTIKCGGRLTVRCAGRWHSAQGIRRDGDDQGLDSIVAGVGVCRLPLRQNQLGLHMQHAIVWVSAEMPVRLLQVAHGSSPRGLVLEISITLYPPTIVLSLSSCVSPVIADYRYPESKQCPFLPPSPFCLPYIDTLLEILV